MDGWVSVSALNFALNEARWLAIDPRPDIAACLVIFDVLTLPADDGGDGHAIRGLALRPVSRISASYRLGRWDNASAEVAPVAFDDLNHVLESFDGQPIYGMEFIDPPTANCRQVRNRPSLDVVWAERDPKRVLHLVQESSGEPDRILEVLIEFDSFDGLFDDANNGADIIEFVNGARRWWEGLRAGDARTSSSLIHLEGSELPPVGGYLRASNAEAADVLQSKENEKKRRWPRKRPSDEHT